MRIILENDDRLELRDRPWAMPVCLAVLCALFGYGVWTGVVPGDDFPWPFLLLPPLAFVFLIYYFEHLEVVFDRTSDAVQVTRRRLTGRRQSKYRLSALTKIETIGTPDLDGGAHRIALFVEGFDKPVPLTFYESNSPSVHLVEKRLQAWLRRGSS